jgi:hypothetical protein
MALVEPDKTLEMATAVSKEDWVETASSQILCIVNNSAKYDN